MPIPIPWTCPGPDGPPGPPPGIRLCPAPFGWAGIIELREADWLWDMDRGRGILAFCAVMTIVVVDVKGCKGN